MYKPNIKWSQNVNKFCKFNLHKPNTCLFRKHKVAPKKSINDSICKISRHIQQQQQQQQQQQKQQQQQQQQNKQKQKTMNDLGLLMTKYKDYFL